jgi:hypothetical protein
MRARVDVETLTKDRPPLPSSSSEVGGRESGRSFIKVVGVAIFIAKSVASA